MTKKEIKIVQNLNIIILTVIMVVLLFTLIFGVVQMTRINEIQNTIQNKTLEPNQTLAYGLGYSNGYYQCVEEVQQLQEEGKL